MAVVVVGNIPNGTKEMYEAVNDKVMPGRELPEGCQAHIAGPVDGGWRVITVWDAAEDFHRFRDERLMPAFQELGAGPGGPEVDIGEVDTLLLS